MKNRKSVSPIRSTYNTVVARAILQRWVPEALREVTPPAPARPEPTTEAGRCFRTVADILEGGERARALPSPFKAPELHSATERAAVARLRGAK